MAAGFEGFGAGFFRTTFLAAFGAAFGAAARVVAFCGRAAFLIAFLAICVSNFHSRGRKRVGKFPVITRGTGEEGRKDPCETRGFIREHANCR